MIFRVILYVRGQKSAFFKKNSLTDCSNSEFLKKNSLADSSGSEFLKKNSLTDCLGSEFLKKNSLPDSSDSEFLKKNSLTDSSDSEFLKKNFHAQKKSRATNTGLKRSTSYLSNAKMSASRFQRTATAYGVSPSRFFMVLSISRESSFLIVSGVAVLAA